MRAFKVEYNVSGILVLSELVFVNLRFSFGPRCSLALGGSPLPLLALAAALPNICTAR